MSRVSDTKATTKGWRCSNQLNAKLWTGITHALFDLQPWMRRMRLLVPNNFRGLTFDLRPLDFSQFWIIISNFDSYFWWNRAVAFYETGQNGRGSCRTATEWNSQTLAKGWRYSTQLKIQTLNRYNSCPVWPTATKLRYTYASPHAEQL